MQKLPLRQEKTQEQKQLIVKKYNSFFLDVQNKLSFALQNISEQQLEHHRIKIIQKQPLMRQTQRITKDGPMYLEYSGSSQNGTVCRYEVFVGNFYLIVTLLNLQRNSEDEHNMTAHLGTGSYGVVKRVDLGEHKIAVKKINFQKVVKNSIFLPHLMSPDDYADRFEIRKVLKEYSIYKICSMLQIGPKVLFNEAYDIVCYNDCIQFCMQLCQRPEDAISTYSAYEKDLKKCLNILHGIKFVHKDIKPDNILFSPSQKKYVLSDFGITHSIKQEIYQESLTYFEGSYKYTSQQMKKLYNCDQSGNVNLYLNDIFALQVTIEELRELGNIEKEEAIGSYGQNSLSWMAEESQVYEEYGQIAEQPQLSIPLNAQTQQGNIQTNTSISQNSTTGRTLSIDFMRLSGEINFYQMKTMYELFTQQMKIPQITKTNHEIARRYTEEQIKATVLKCCQKCNNQNIRNSVLILTKDYLIPVHDFQFLIFRLRNCLRVFGIYSEQTAKILLQILTSKAIPYARHSQISNLLSLIQCHKEAQVSMKNMSTCLLDTYRSFYLRNNRSAIQAIKALFKKCIHNMKMDLQEYKAKNNNKIELRSFSDSEKKIILVGGLYALNMNDISHKESNQIYRCLGYIAIKLLNPTFNVYNADQKQIPHQELVMPLKNKRDLSKQLKASVLQLVQIIITEGQNVFQQQGPEINIYKALINAYANLNLYQKSQNLMSLVAKTRMHHQLSYQNSDEYAQKLLKGYQAVKFINVEIQYYVNLGTQIEFALDLAIEARKILEEIQKLESQKKQQKQDSRTNELSIVTYDKLTMLYIKNYSQDSPQKLQYLNLAQKYNNISLQLKYKQYFPKRQGHQFAYSRFHQANIYAKRKQYQQAIEEYSQSLSNLKQNIRQESHTLLIKQNLVNLAHCYQRVDKNQEAFQFLQSAYEYSQVYHFKQPEVTVHILQNMTVLLLKMGQIDGVLRAYIDQLAYLKHHILETKRINTTPQFNKKIIFYNLQRLKNESISGESQILIRKFLITSLKNYLPTFLSFYCNTCDELVSHYINQKKMYNQGLHYLFRWFSARPKVSKDQDYYRKADFFISILIATNSSRRALKFLRQYIYQIPEQFEPYRTQAYSKMYTLTKELNTPQKMFYNYVWKLKPYANKKNYIEALDSIRNDLTKCQWEKKIWIKKLYKVAPEETFSIKLIKEKASNQVFMNQSI